MNIEEYLTNEEKQRIASEVFRDECKKYLKDEDAVKRIISNAAYDITYNMVDSTINEDLSEMLSKKVVEIIDDLSCFSVFKKPDAWSKESNSMYQLLERELINRKSELGDVVIKTLQKAPKEYIRVIGQDAFTKIVSDAMKIK